LRMFTMNPAMMLGIEDKVGSLEEGKQGDVVLLTGDPFDAFSRVEQTIIDGIVYYDSNREEETRGEPFNAFPDLPADRYRPTAGADGPGSGVQSRSVNAAELDPLSPEAGTVALVGATIHPVSGPAIEDGTLVMHQGRIQAVGPRDQVEVPQEARTVDVSGRHLYPGMIDPLTHLGLFEIGAVSQATDRNEIGELNPHIRALEAYQPHGRAPFVARARGITAVLTAQTGGLIQGMGSVVQLRGDTWERAEIQGDAALMVNLPVPSTAPGSSAGWGEFGEHQHGAEFTWAGDALFHHHHDLLAMAGGTAAFAADRSARISVGGEHGLGFPAAATAARLDDDGPEPSLDTGRMDELVDFFRRAVEYSQAPESARRGDEHFEANIWGGDGVVLEAMLPVLRGEIPILFRADSEWQLRHVFLFLEEFPEVEGVVVGGAEAFRLAGELAERDVPVILTRTRSPTPDRDDSTAAAMRNAAALHQAGVRFALGTDESADVRNLPEHAAIAVAYGLAPDAALEAVTRRPAEILGLGDEMGTLDPGKRADLLVTDGNPLQPLTHIETMFIAGHEVDPRDNDHSRMYREFRDRR